MYLPQRSACQTQTSLITSYDLKWKYFLFSIVTFHKNLFQFQLYRVVFFQYFVEIANNTNRNFLMITIKYFIFTTFKHHKTSSDLNIFFIKRWSNKLNEFVQIIVISFIHSVCTALKIVFFRFRFQETKNKNKFYLEQTSWHANHRLTNNDVINDVMHRKDFCWLSKIFLISMRCWTV